MLKKIANKQLSWYEHQIELRQMIREAELGRNRRRKGHRMDGVNLQDREENEEYVETSMQQEETKKMDKEKLYS